MEYRSLYALGKEKLAAAGIPEADLDARLLLEYVCHTSRNDLLVHGDREVAETEQQAYEQLLAKRAEHIPLQQAEPGDCLAVLATGAYNYSMASNYNRVPRPPLVLVRDGEDRLAVRREQYADMVRCDVCE